jgi:hypothetical protein
VVVLLEGIRRGQLCLFSGKSFFFTLSLVKFT